MQYCAVLYIAFSLIYWFSYPTLLRVYLDFNSILFELGKLKFLHNVLVQTLVYFLVKCITKQTS